MKHMTFEAARKKLQRIAKGEYCTLRYSLTIPGRGQTPEVVCEVYIHGTNWHDGNTWAEAFCSLKREIDEPKPPDPVEQPEEGGGYMKERTRNRLLKLVICS